MLQTSTKKNWMVDFGSNRSTETFLHLPKMPYVSEYIEKKYVLESSVPGNFGISQWLFNNEQWQWPLSLALYFDLVPVCDFCTIWSLNKAWSRAKSLYSHSPSDGIFWSLLCVSEDTCHVALGNIFFVAFWSAYMRRQKGAQTEDCVSMLQTNGPGKWFSWRWTCLPCRKRQKLPASAKQFGDARACSRWP